MEAMRSPDRDAAGGLLRRLAETPLGSQLVLGGSSGLFTASERIPPLTEDLDLLIDAEWLAAHEETLIAEMAVLGFRHHPGTCTFTRGGDLSVDLVGYSRRDAADRIGGGRRVPVMVYGDLSTVMAAPEATRDSPDQGRSLSPAALAVVKLLTVRLEKGAKDKLQALLLVEENADDPGFAAQARSLLERFDRDRREDALADAQAALLTLSADPLLGDPQAAGYAALRVQAERGLAALQGWLGVGRPGAGK
jgi:hypothetical protein